MLIQPDTYIKLIKNCPLDDTYDHTIYFNNESEQVNYFKNTLDGITFAKQSYQRYDSGVLHIQEKAERLYSCNYLMFQNTAFGNKWFYAFVNKVEYVNNVSSKVYYTIDVMQTWFFDYELKECFVEREHSLTDAVGENLIPEKLDTGDYVYKPVNYSNNSAKVTPFKSFNICVMATFDKELNPSSGGYYGNTYSGLCLNFFDNANEANSFIEAATGDNKADEIIAVLMIPSGFVSAPLSTPSEPVGYTEEIRVNKNIDTYIPKNNKLLTYPYNFIMATNNEGKSNDYRYEYFFKSETVPNDFVAFHVNASRCNSYEYSLTPWFYKGLGENANERLVIGSSPQCAYNVDTYKAWLAQNAASLAVDAVEPLFTGFGAAIAGLTGHPAVAIGLGTSTYNKITSNLSAYADHYTLPNSAKGVSNVGSLNINTGVFGFSLFYATIRREYAEIIDGYFDMFGYATNKVKKPNTHSRPHWNFVKTGSCVATGGVPADDLKKICEIYDGGITFWKNGNEIGNYSLDNRP